MNNDFTWETMMDWIEGRLDSRLSDQDAQRLEAALAAASDATQADATWLRAFYKLSASVPFKHLSDGARQKLRTQFEQLQTAQRPESQPLAALSRAFRVWVASLTLDSWTTPLVGVRHGEGTRDSRQLIYTTELAEVALNIRPHSQTGAFDLRGQIFASTAMNLQSVSAQLVQNQLFRQAYISDLGNFVFGNVLAGDRKSVV